MAAATIKSGGQRTAGRQGKPRETLRTCAFDSVGPKKYALQVQRASNGNPCLRIVQGSPNGDGTFRRFDITIWSEDFDALFSAMDDVRRFIRDKHIKTPAGHSYKPKASMRSNVK